MPTLSLAARNAAGMFATQAERLFERLSWFLLGKGAADRLPVFSNVHLEPPLEYGGPDA